MAVATGAAAALALSACAGDESDVGGDGEGDGGIFNMPIGEVRSLIPGGAGESEGYRVIKNVYDGLVYYNADTGEAENLVAEEITSEDNQTWTITIKEGLTFHNGEPVDAEAFIRGWNRVAYAPNSLPLNYFMATIEGYGALNPDPLPEEEWADPDVPEFPDDVPTEMSGLTAVDDHTLEVNLTSPFLGFPTMLGYEAFFPLAQECLDDLEACEARPIGNGPFMFEEPYDVESGGTAVTWDDYQGEMPSIGGVTWNVYLEGNDCWADFETGDIDICRPTAATYESAQNDPELQERHIAMPDPSITMLGLPLYDEKFQDIDLRHALSMAIDREGVLNVIGPERGTPLDGWVPESILGGGQGACGEYCEYNPDEAQRLFDASDWPEGEKLRIWVNDSNDNVDIFRAIGDSITESIGLEYELVTMEWTDYLAEREAHGLDGPFRDGWGPDYNLNENYLEPIYGGGFDKNDNGFESEEYDAKIAEATAAETLDEAVALYQEAEAILAETFPSVPLWAGKINFYYTERVQNAVVNPIYAAPGGDLELRDVELTE